MQEVFDVYDGRFIEGPWTLGALAGWLGTGQDAPAASWIGCPFPSRLHSTLCARGKRVDVDKTPIITSILGNLQVLD